MDQYITAETIISDTIKKYPSQCNIQFRYDECGWHFASLKAYFMAFTVNASLISWDSLRGRLTTCEHRAIFPDTAARFFFDSGSILLVYASGHIRWITNTGLAYYAALSSGDAPIFTQGDLVVFALQDELPVTHYAMLEVLLPEDQSSVWCRAAAPESIDQSQVWYTMNEIALGGNARHKAVGRMSVCMPIDGEYRTMRVDTLSSVQITHDPVDAIHPTIYLDADQRYLITKLPGFSNPLYEMKPCSEVQQ